MFRYKSKCRWNMLLFIDGEVVEIRPGEFLESKTPAESRYLKLIEPTSIITKKKGGTKKKSLPKSIEVKDINATSSST